MSVLGGEFALILLVSGQWNTIAKLESSLAKLEEKFDLKILKKRTESKKQYNDCMAYTVEIVTIDHPGIVYKIANFFSSRSINIDDLQTNCYAAAHTGAPVFTMNLRVMIPKTLSIAELREQFLDFCDQTNLDAVIEPVKL